MLLPSVSTSLILAASLGIAEAVALYFGSGILVNIMGIPAVCHTWLITNSCITSFCHYISSYCNVSELCTWLEKVSSPKHQGGIGEMVGSWLQKLFRLQTFYFDVDYFSNT